MVALINYTLLFTMGLCLLVQVNSQAEQPRIIVSPSYHCANQTSFLSWTCIAYVGQQANYQPTTINWYNGANEQLSNDSQVTIYSNVVIINGLVFIESTLEASVVYSHLTGESSCEVSNAVGQDRASWVLMYYIPPPVTVIMKPANQVANYTGVVRMTCLALIQQEQENDTAITWWGESGQFTNDTDMAIYTNRITSGELVFIESLLEVCYVNYIHLGRLACVAENAFGRDIANWTVEPPIRYPPPRLTITPSTARLSYGGTVNVSCNANVGPQAAYSIDPAEVMWMDVYGQQIVPIDNQINVSQTMDTIGGNMIVTLTLGINSIGVNHVGDLQCVVGSIFGTDSATFTVQTYEILTTPELLLTPLNKTIDCRSRATLTCVITAFPVPNVQWYFNGAYVDTTASENVNVNHYYGSTIGLNFTESYLDVCDFNDENVGAYWCSASNILGNYTSIPIWINIDQQTAPPVLPPRVTSVERTSNAEAMVTFEPQSLGTFEIAYYTANDSTTPYLIEKIDSVWTTINDEPRARLRGLDTCSRYWVVITGRYCSHMGSTDPTLIELNQVNPYELTLTLGGKNDTCKTWITKDPEAKANDMEQLLGSLASNFTPPCQYNIPCFKDSAWKCTDEDQMKVTFDTRLVGYSQETVSIIAKCIDEWITGGKAVGQTFFVGNTNLTVRNFEEPSDQREILPIWAWIVIAVGGALLIACLICIFFSFTICARCRQSGSKKEMLINEEGDGKSYTEVAVVDNPLYAENEGDVAAYLEEDGKPEEEEFEFEANEPKKTEI